MLRSTRAPLTCALAAVLALALSPSSGLAAPKTAASKPATELRMRTAPKRLSAAKMLVRVNLALAKIGAPPLTSAPQQLEMRITPMTPMLDNGAHVVEARNVSVVGPGPVAPGGAYGLQMGATSDSSVTLEFPAEIGTIQAFDCRIRAYYLGGETDPQVRIEGSDFATSTTYSQDGHVLIAVTPEHSTTQVKLTWTNPGALSMIAFFGCDFGNLAG